MSKILVSIIITTKNSSKTLDGLLRSNIKQTFKDFEIVVVDNRSSDNTLEIAGRYTKKVYTQGPERSAQRNFGAKKASGKYLLFLDSDMELTPRVVKECVELSGKQNYKALVIPERTVGEGFLPSIRKFEREMYMRDPTIEVARFFDKKVFFEYGGYDLSLTGPEDYDLPYRISKKYRIGRTRSFILHHEEGLTLSKLVQKKYYYARNGALYAKKHPELIFVQGNLLFRPAYLRHWKNFIKHPLLGLEFIFVRTLETAAAILGFIRAVGIVGFTKTVFKALSV